MFINSHEILAFISALIKIVAYVPYFRDIARGKCHPHAFSWLIWFVIDFIAFLIQYVHGAGAGAFPTLFGCLISLAIAILGLLIGKRDIVRSDYMALFAALGALPLWYFAKSPLMVLAVIITIDFIGFFPTWRKATLRPDEERSMTFFLLSISNVFAIFSIDVMIAENLIYPIYVSVSLMATALYVMCCHKKIHGHYNLIKNYKQKKKKNDMNNWFS